MCHCSRKCAQFEYKFGFICSEKCINNISSHNNFDLFSYILKKGIPDATTLTFQEVGGLLNPSYFVESIRFSYGISLIITQLIDYYCLGILTLLFSTVFIEIYHDVNS